MKFSILFKLLFLLTSLSQAQLHSGIITLTPGKVNFGTGDFSGYGVNIGYFKPLKKTGYLNHFRIGGELGFENGTRNPKVINPTVEEFLANTFYATTNASLAPMIEYFPLQSTFLKNISIGVAVAVGYTNQSFERQASWVYDSVNQIAVRRSYLDYIKQGFLGYRITAGYLCDLGKNISFGLRLDWENYNGDINTIVAGRVGYRF